MNANALSETFCGLSPAEQQQITEILDEYLQQIENGESPAPEKLLERYPQWSGMLRRYLESLGVIHHASRVMHGADPEPFGLTDMRRLGDYEIKRQIGRGGMGIVYEARQVSLDRRVALKVLPLAAVLDQRQIARFRREAQAAAQLHHPHIVPVFGVGCEEGVHFYSMQLVEGQSIDRVLGSLQSESVDETTAITVSSARSRPNDSNTISIKCESTVEEPLLRSRVSATSISQGDSVVDRRFIDRVAELGIQAASALQHAHDYGVIHRDIKPSNLMLDLDGKLWITDFGLAHIQSEADMTATGDLVGTLRYMSPEQAGTSQVVDQRTDIYSLGITLYEMLTMKQALAATDRQQLLRDIENLEPKRIRKLNPAIPIDLETIVLKAISKDRDQRYARAQHFADDLQRYLDGKPTLARRPTLIDLGTKWAFRHRALVACFFLMLTAALLGTSTSLVLIKNQKDIAEEHAKIANERFRLARQIVDRFTDMSRRLTKQPRIQREMQQTGRQYYLEFLQQAAHDRTLVSDLASTQIQIGGISEQLGDIESAIESYRRAAESYRELGVNRRAYQHDEALSLNNLGQALARAERVSEARQCLTSAFSILESLEHQTEQATQRQLELTALVAGNLGQFLAENGETQQALKYLKQAVKIRHQIRLSHPEDTENRIRLASNYHNLCDVLVSSEIAQAEAYCHKAIELQQQLIKERPDDLQPRSDLALSFNNRGAIALRKRDLVTAEHNYQRAIELGKILVGEARDIPQLRHDLGISWNNLGQSRSLAGDFHSALAAYEAAETQFNELLVYFPDDAWTRARLGGTLHNQAVAIQSIAPVDLVKSAKLFERAIEMQRNSVKAAPNTTQYANLLKLSLSKYVDILHKLGKQQKLTEVRHELAALQTEGSPHAN